MIRKIKKSAAQFVLNIYQKGLKTNNASFETHAPSWNEWNKRFLPFCRFVYEESGMLLGWIALTPVTVRECYAGVAELSIYVDLDYFGKGIGSKLLEFLIRESEKHGIWTLQATVFPENEVTLKLHEKFGFRKIGYHEKIAKHFGKWRDTIILERRSKI